MHGDAWNRHGVVRLPSIVDGSKDGQVPSVEPRGVSLPLPAGYGAAKKPLLWSEIDRLLVEARVYWIATSRPDGRPHVVPSDGIWLDGVLYFGGSSETVHMRNVRETGRAAVHIGDGLTEAVIVEGRAGDETPERDVAERLAEANNTKYADYGFTMKPETYLESGVTALHAERALAWTRFPEDATRFTFPQDR